VLGIVLILHALILIQQNILKKQVAFKKIAKINLAAIVTGTVVGIVFAFLGYGVWSLVIKTLVTGVVQCVIFWLKSRWRPQWIFSRVSLKSLFRFGSFMFLNTMLNNLYQNALSLIIGKNFSAAILGHFTQARKLQDIPRNTLSSVINNVTFPVFSEMQEDKERLRNAAGKCLKSLAFINFPLMMLMIVIAEPLVLFLFTEKWIQAVPYFQALCLYGLIFSIYELNGIMVISIGKSKLSFFARLAEHILGITLIIAGLNWGMKGVLFGYVISAYISYLIISFFTGKLIGYGFLQQSKDVFKIFIVSVVSAGMAYSLSLTNIHFGWLLGIQILLFSTAYSGLSKLFKIEELDFYYQQIKKQIIKT
jgi:O-antigen/teichoic acid export membrane protein